VKKKVLWAVSVLVLIFSSLLMGQETRVSSILQNPRAYRDEVVTLEGFITQYVEATAKSTSFYFIKDDWGAILKVRTSKEKPDVGKRYSVRGPVSIDPITREPYLSEESRTEMAIGQLQAPAPAPTPVPAPVPVPQKNNLIYILVAAIVIVAVLILYLLYKALRRRSAEGLLTEEPAVQGLKVPPPEEMLEGKTVKIAIPPAGTLKLLPGRLIVVSGEDNVKELRFYRTKNQDENEILFGRAAGTSYNYVQLKSMTVSAKHAKMIYAGGKFTIINYSSTNPVKVNSKDLEVNGSSVLNDGDKVELGEVVFEFRAQ
jgi:hypothetical protein